MRFHARVVASLTCLAATVPASAFVPSGGLSARPLAGTGSNLAVTSSPAEAETFQRSLLEARLRLERGDSRVVEKTLGDKGTAAESELSTAAEAFQRALLADRLGREAARKAEGAAAAAVDAAAKAAEDARQAELDRIEAERSAQEAKQEEVGRIAAEKLAEEAERAAAAEEEAKRLEEAKKVDEGARIAAEEEARIAAAAGEEEEEEEERIAASKTKAAAEGPAEAAKRAAFAAAEEEVEALSSRTAELKARAKRVADRVPFLSGSRPLLPSGDDVSSALAKVQDFNPREAADQLKLRKESDTELVRATAAGFARAAVDGFGTGIEIADAVRGDEELKSVVKDAIATASAASKILVQPSPLDDDGDATASFQRKAKIAYIALDSIGLAVYVSMCGLLGYSSTGPVSESASRAAEGFISAISAATALGLRSADKISEAAQKATKEADDVAEGRTAAEERISAEEARRAEAEGVKAAETPVVETSAAGTESGSQTKEAAAAAEEEAEVVEPTDISIPYDAAARLVYDQWRAQYGKGDFDASKYDIFKANYDVVSVANVVAKKHARETGQEVSLIGLGADADSVLKDVRTLSATEEAAPQPKEGENEQPEKAAQANEEFQRALLEARLRSEKNSAPDLQEEVENEQPEKAQTQEEFHRALLEARLRLKENSG